MGNCEQGNVGSQQEFTIDQEESIDEGFDFTQEKEKIMLKNRELTTYVQSGTEQIKIEDQKTYDGEVHEGKADGMGIFVVEDKYQYNGEWKNGKPNGYGILNFYNGDIYEGMVKDGIIEGEGKYTFSKGFYEGNFLNGKYDGEGRVEWNDGKVYKGNFKNGQFHGQGTYEWPDKKKFVGQYINGIRQGEGKLYLENNGLIEGQWQDGKLVQGQLSKDGEIFRSLQNKEEKVEQENQQEEQQPEQQQTSQEQEQEKQQEEVKVETEKKEEPVVPQNDKETSKVSEEPKEKSEEKKEKKDPDIAQMELDKVLKINQTSIDFGNVFPGQILEETIIILNNMNETKVHFKIKINCLTKEFDDLDEYVYSMRRPTQNDVFNYNDTFLILLSHKAISYYKLAIKVPNWNEEKEIMGNVEISSEMTKADKVIIPVRSKIVIPSLICEKMIKLKRLEMPVIKLFLKTVKRQDFRVALKNNSVYNCIGELSVLKNPKLDHVLEVNFYPPQISMQANMPNNFMMSIKSITQSDEELLNQEFRFVLLVRVRHSSIIFSYPVLLNVGDGRN